MCTNSIQTLISMYTTIDQILFLFVMFSKINYYFDYSFLKFEYIIFHCIPILR